jgi:hypothetical protein
VCGTSRKSDFFKGVDCGGRVNAKLGVQLFKFIPEHLPPRRWPEAGRLELGGVVPALVLVLVLLHLLNLAAAH